MACVIKEGIINRRLETFARLCGLTLDGHKEGHLNFNESQCSFFFRAIGILFGQNVHLLTECMNSFVSRLLLCVLSFSVLRFVRARA